MIADGHIFYPKSVGVMGCRSYGVKLGHVAYYEQDTSQVLLNSWSRRWFAFVLLNLKALYKYMRLKRSTQKTQKQKNNNNKIYIHSYLKPSLITTILNTQTDLIWSGLFL